jgi:dephospho-CoA kinase
LQQQWQPQAEKAFQQRDLFFIAEIPLLYEIFGLASFFDYVIVVGASQNVQLERLVHQRHLSHEEAFSFLQIQLPLDEKIARADYLLWNDGSPLLFEKQLTQAVTALLNF